MSLRKAPLWNPEILRPLWIINGTGANLLSSLVDQILMQKFDFLIDVLSVTISQMES